MIFWKWYDNCITIFSSNDILTPDCGVSEQVMADRASTYISSSWISSLFFHRRFWKSSSVFTRCISKFCKLSNHGSLDSSSGWHLWKYEKLKNWKNRYWISKLDYGMGWVFGVWAAPVGAASLLLLSLLYNCHRLDPCSGGGDQYPHPPWLQLRVCPPLPLTTLHFTILQHCIVVLLCSFCFIKLDFD